MFVWRRFPAPFRLDWLLTVKDMFALLSAACSGKALSPLRYWEQFKCGGLEKNRRLTQPSWQAGLQLDPAQYLSKLI